VLGLSDLAEGLYSRAILL